MKKALFIIPLLMLCLTGKAAEGFKLVGGATAMGWPADPAPAEAGYVLSDKGDGTFVYEGMLYPANGEAGHDGEFKFMVIENGSVSGWRAPALHPTTTTDVGTVTASGPANLDGTDDRKWIITTTGWYRITIADNGDGHNFTVTTEFLSPFRIVGGAYNGWSTGAGNTQALSYCGSTATAVYSAEVVLNHNEGDTDASAFKILTDEWAWLPCVCAAEPSTVIGAFAPFESGAFLRTSDGEADNKWVIGNTGLYEVKLSINDHAVYSLSAQYAPSLTVISGESKVACTRTVGDGSVVFTAEFDAVGDGYALLLGHADEAGNGWYLVADNGAAMTARSGDTPALKPEYCNIEQARIPAEEGSYNLSADLSDWNSPSAQVEHKTTTALDGIAADNDVPAEFYTLTGLKVEAPLAPGIYVVRRGTMIQKMIIR